MKKKVFLVLIFLGVFVIPFSAFALSSDASSQNWFNTFWTNIYTPLRWALDGVVSGLKYVAYGIFDGMLSVVTSILAALNISQIAFDAAGAWGLIPSQLLWLITQCGIPQGVSLVMWAVTIRLGLNLIPGWLTRV